MDSSELRAGYEVMSKDADQESEALEWCDALIGDVLSGLDGRAAGSPARAEALGRDDTAWKRSAAWVKGSFDSGAKNWHACAQDDNEKEILDKFGCG